MEGDEVSGRKNARPMSPGMDSSIQSNTVAVQSQKKYTLRNIHGIWVIEKSDKLKLCLHFDDATDIHIEEEFLFVDGTLFHISEDKGGKPCLLSVPQVKISKHQHDFLDKETMGTTRRPLSARMHKRFEYVTRRISNIWIVTNKSLSRSYRLEFEGSEDIKVEENFLLAGKSLYEIFDIKRSPLHLVPLPGAKVRTKFDSNRNSAMVVTGIVKNNGEFIIRRLKCGWIITSHELYRTFRLPFNDKKDVHMADEFLFVDGELHEIDMSENDELYLDLLAQVMLTTTVSTSKKYVAVDKIRQIGHIWILKCKDASAYYRLQFDGINDVHLAEEFIFADGELHEILEMDGDLYIAPLQKVLTVAGSYEDETSEDEAETHACGDNDAYDDDDFHADHVYEEIEVPPTSPTCQPPKSKAKPDCSLRIFHEDKSEPVTIPNSRIIVRGLPETASQEAIELFFENKKRTGGGTVKKIELKLNKGAAVIEFENHLDAKSVLEKAASGTLKFTGTNNPLSVSSYIPPPMDPKKLFIQGIADNSTDDFVRLYLEKASQMEPINIIWGQTPDVNTIQEFCRKRPCEGKAWEVSEVEQSRSVKVTGYGHRASNETMELYFENKPKSHGGDVENVEKHFEESAFIIMFKNPEDAVRVCQTSLKHVVDDSVLSVSMYLPCLDRDPSTTVVIPEPVVVTFLDEQAVRFLQKSPLYKRKVEKSLEENYGVPKWTSDQEGELVLEVECNVNPKDVAAKRKVEQWSNNCSRCLSWASEEILVNRDILVAVEIWDDMKKHISQIEVPKPEAIAVFLDNKSSSVTVVGEYKMADWLSKRIISIVNEIEEKKDRENQIVTKVQTLRHFEVSLIRATKLEGVIKKEEVEVELKGDTREFIIKGKIRNVENALQKLKKLLKGFAKQEVAGYTKHGMDLLFKKETRDYIKKQLSKEHLVGVWDVLNRGEKLIMYSRNPSDLERVVKILRDTLKEFVVTVDSDCRGLLDNGENSVVKQIQRKHAGLVNIVVNQQEIRIACLNTLVSEITVEIETYLDSYKMVSEYIDTSSARFTYIMQYKKQELRRIESQYDRLGLRVAVVDETRKKGFKVTGKKDACRQAITKLRELIDNITQTELTLNWPGFDKFVRSSDGRGALSTIEVEDKCLLNVNIQAGNILKTDVDVIVNPSFKTLVNTLGLGKALLEQGGQKIQQECDELRRRQSQFEAGTVFGTSAGKLSFKAIYHAVVPIWEGGTNDEMRFLRRAVGNCLKMAERQSMSSIAFPPIGKGMFKFPVQKVAEVLVGRIEEYFRKDSGSSSLRKVVICDNQADSHSSFLRQFSNFEGVQMRHRGASSERGDRGGRLRCGIAIEVVLESLVAQKVDVIVNSTNTNLDLNVGMISRQLVKAAGESLMQECKSTYPSGIQYGQVAQTLAGDLPIKALFHGVLPRWDDGKGQSEAILVRFVNNCLEKAETRGFTSIAFPALGTGACGFPSDIVASTMFEVVERYSEKTPNSRIKRVLFVIWKDDISTVKAFQAVQDDRKSGARSRSSRETRASVYMLKPQQDFFEEGDFLPWTKSEPETGQNVTIHIYTESSHRAEIVKRHLRQLHEEEEMYFSSTIMSKLKDDQINKVKSCGKENSKVFKTRDGFKIVGYGRCVGRSKEAVEQVMTAFEKDIRVEMVKPSVKLPSNWSKMSLDDKTRIDKLTPIDKDYKMVAQKFTAETGFTQILQIQRIQNPTLYMQYAAKKKQMENMGQENVERMLWHGTRTPEVANNICIKGFDRNYNSGVFAWASHGAGVYFSVKASMSAQGYCAPDAAGNKHIFYTHVLTGDFCVGQRGIRVPTPKAPGNNLITYDSTTDNVTAPNFFVIFQDSQAYPSYLIVFK